MNASKSVATRLINLNLCSRLIPTWTKYEEQKMNKVLGCIAAAMTLAALSGCTTYDRAESYVTKPVVKDVKKGMTREQVRQIAGPASTEVTMAHARGTCQTYVIGERDGKMQTYFVSYNDTGRVMNYGFQSCKEYDTDPQVAQ
jgi:osmotically inducible lipoprotein OsmE